MAGTVRGKVDCYFNETSAVNLSQCMYKNVHDFLVAHAAAGGCERVARHTGRTSGTTAQQVGALDYYDGSNPFLANAWSVFKFPAKGSRTYDWYLHVQWGGSSFGSAPGSPGKFLNGSGSQCLGFSAAIGVGGSPWNGTTNWASADPPSGNDSKGTPVWTDPGSGVHVFPRSNNTGGTHATNRENMVGFQPGGGQLVARMHMMADDDSIVLFCSDNDDGQYKWTYIGPYVPRTGASPTFPLVMVNYTGTTFAPTASTFGSTTGTTTQEGGAIEMTPGQVRGFRIDRLLNILGIQRYGNLNTRLFDTFPITIYMNEGAETGLLGQITNIQECAGLISHDVSALPLLGKVVLGTMAPSDPKIVAPWSATLGVPARTVWTRTGSTF